MEEGNLYHDLKKLGEKYAGVYLLNKFFIRIITGKSKIEIPDYDYQTKSLPIPDQLKLQTESFVTLFHEYIHYIHEISTIAGILQFQLEVFNRAIFSFFVNLPKSSIAREITGDPAMLFRRVKSTIDATTGGSVGFLNGQIIYRIDRIEMAPFPAYFEPFANEPVVIGLPSIYYTYGDISNTENPGLVYFGKYYLYEGLAHHLDQIVGQQRGVVPTPKHLVSPEYKMMEMVARSIFPTIEEKDMLYLASFSLAFPNCGEQFVRMVETAADVPYPSGYVMEMYNKTYAHLKERQPEINDILANIKKAFVGRRSMENAANHLCNEMANAYQQRMDRLAFEVDVVYERRPEELADYVIACDMVYEFDDGEEVMRDFAGTYLDNQLAADLKTFLCNVDYYQSSVNHIPEHCCPLFSFCAHQIRLDKASQCKTQPRLAFEDQPVYGWCNYSYGVAYMNGQELKSN